MHERTRPHSPRPQHAARAARVGHERDVVLRTQPVDHQLQRAATSGGVTLGQQTVPVAPLVADLRVALLKVHSGKDLVIDADVAADAGFAGDGGDITELLGNLIDNACKWCRGMVRIQVRLDTARPMEQRLLIRVEDDGPGIAPEDRARVLGRGVRADRCSSTILRRRRRR